MTYKEIADMVGGFGLPYAYYEFPNGTEQEPPFICFIYNYDDFHADNSNYVGKVELIIELYTVTKDFALETSLESYLTTFGLSWGKTAAYIDSEKMWQIAYSTEVYINA